MPACAGTDVNCGDACSDKCDLGKMCGSAGMHANCKDELVCGGAGTCVRPSSCKALKARGTTTSGTYKLNTEAHVYDTFCDMDDGDGWTLVLKGAGADPQFEYREAIWYSDKLIPGSSADLAPSPAKFDSFNYSDFSEVKLCLGAVSNDGCRTFTNLVSNRLDGGGPPKFAAKPYPSLREVFFNSQTITADLPSNLDSWLPNTSLQTKCKSAGLRRKEGSYNVRIGVIMNGEDDCNSPDSWIGFGANDPQYPSTGGCTDRNALTNTYGGHVSNCYDANKKIPAFGWVFVR
jgi:hypothetical protein